MFFRHGNILIRRIDEIKGTLKPTSEDVIIAEDTKTGHAHRFKSENGIVHLYEDNGNLYIKVLSEVAKVTHEDFSPVIIPYGDYEITIQNEYSYVNKHTDKNFQHHQTH